MGNFDEYLNHLKELALRNKNLDAALKELLSKYESMDTDTQYQALIKEFGLDDSMRKNQADVVRFKMASMIYVSVLGFEKLSKVPDAQSQIDDLDEMYILISDIAAKYNLCKIPTIGDNMLLAGGVLKPSKTSPIDAVCAACEIMYEVGKLKETSDSIWDLSIGIHTGPALGRFAGKRQIPYTLSGNNALIASRLGSAAEAGHTIISMMTYELVKEFFDMQKIGIMPVKYNGVMDTYLLNGIEKSLKVGDSPIELGPKFKLIYRRMQFLDIQEEVLDMLETKLPKNLYYHNVKHTIDVTTEVELIGWAEGLSEEDVQLLKVAGLFHDTGHIMKYSGHEECSCEIAADMLPKFNYTPEEIEKIRRIIMATKLPHVPADKLEAVIQDSDLDYLGRSDFIPVSNLLYQELKERNMIGTIDEWNKMQLAFIGKHQYFTQTATSLREVNKQNQIERIEQLLNKSESEAAD